jgi:hypothetical protein
LYELNLAFLLVAKIKKVGNWYEDTTPSDDFIHYSTERLAAKGGFGRTGNSRPGSFHPVTNRILGWTKNTSNL